MISRRVSQHRSSLPPSLRTPEDIGLLQGLRPISGRARNLVRRFVLLLATLACVTLLLMPGRLLVATTAAATAPLLMTHANSPRGIALESVMETGEPFRLTMPLTFGGDG